MLLVKRLLLILVETGFDEILVMCLLVVCPRQLVVGNCDAIGGLCDLIAEECHRGIGNAQVALRFHQVVSLVIFVRQVA